MVRQVYNPSNKSSFETTQGRKNWNVPSQLAFTVLAQFSVH